MATDYTSKLVQSLRKSFSLDPQPDQSAAEMAGEFGAGFIPGVGTAMAARDFERARREGDKLGMTLAGVGMVPVLGDLARADKFRSAVTKFLSRADEHVLEALEQRMNHTNDMVMMMENSNHAGDTSRLYREAQGLEAIKNVVENASRNKTIRDESRRHMYVMGADGIPEAAIEYTLRPGSHAELQWLGSTNKGAGAELMNQMINEARQNGVTRVMGDAKFGSFPYYEKRFGAKAAGQWNPLNDSQPFSFDIK